MPPKYRGDIIFVNDSQMFKDKNHMVSEFAENWGAYFYPNTVFYQIGYPNDKKLWNKFQDPIKTWGISIANTHKNPQSVGIFWVDFSLQEVVDEFKKNGDFVIGTKIYDYKGDFRNLFVEFKTAHINMLIASKKLNENFLFRQLAQENQIKRFLLFPVFHDPEFLSTNPDYYSIQKNGRIARKDWVEFVCPSRTDFKVMKINQLKELVQKYYPDGISIDFIRHFIFWEEIYSDRIAESLPNTCFCSNCMSQFQNHIGEQIKVNSPAEFYDWIIKNKKEEWTYWKSSLISTFVRDIVSAVKSINPRILVNLHIVPWQTKDFDNALITVVGQNLKELTKYTDYISPMSYAHMVKQSPQWINDLVYDLHFHSKCKTLPSIQVSKYYLEEEISFDTFQKYIKKGLEYPSNGIIFWSWEMLNDDQKKYLFSLNK
jgi:hypothetical protein